MTLGEYAPLGSFAGLAAPADPVALADLGVLAAVRMVPARIVPARSLHSLSVGSQAVIAAVVVAVAVVAALYAWALWSRGRRLRAADEALTQYWRGLEKVLVEHHQAAEDLVRVADESGALRRRERESVEGAVAAATLTGSPSQRARREHVLHAAVGELRQALEGRPVAATAQVADAMDTYDASWGQVQALGQRYSALVGAFNKMVDRPVLRAWNRHLGWQRAEPFAAPDGDPAGSRLDVL